MSQKKTTMLEAAKKFNIVGAGSMTENGLNLVLKDQVCNWIQTKYIGFTSLEKIMFNLAYIYAYPIRGQANPGLKAIIKLTNEKNGDSDIDSLLAKLNKVARKWNGKKRETFSEFLDPVGENAKGDDLITSIYYLSAWDPFSILEVSEL